MCVWVSVYVVCEKVCMCMKCVNLNMYIYVCGVNMVNMYVCVECEHMCMYVCLYACSVHVSLCVRESCLCVWHLSCV